MLISLLFGVFVISCPTGAVKTLNEVIPLVQVDAYAPCLRARGDVYCFVSATLSGDASHQLYNALLNLSSNVTETVEACLNASLNREYGLKARVFRTSCSEYREAVQYDASDFVFGAILFALLVLNLLGSLHDFCNGDQHTIVGRLLSCFAVRRNWHRLVAPPSDNPKLLSLSGVRVIMSLIVLLVHTNLGSYYTIENSDYVEESYKRAGFQIIYSGIELVNVFTMLSGILLVLNVLPSEKHVTSRNLPKVLWTKWLRFTPVYALMLFFHATWARHVGEGPFWGTIVGVESNDCRRDWWLHLLYIHNYVDHSRCMIHSWSLAVHMQLTAVGCAIFFLLKSARARKAAIILLITVGLLTPAAAIFFNDLHPILIVSPEFVLNWVAHDPTFNYLYKRFHTNVLWYGLGLVMGYVIYNLKESDLGAKKYKKYRTLHRLVIPSMLALQAASSVFYDPALAAPLYVRMFYSSAYKLVIGLLLCLQYFFTLVKADRLISSVYWWRGWTLLARLTYGVYLLNMSILRIRAAASDTMHKISVYILFQEFVQFTIASFLLAVPLFLLVEAPLSALLRLAFTPRHGKKHDE